MNKDFSKSAVNLVNPPEIEDHLKLLAQYQNEKKDIESHIESIIPQDLKDALSNTDQVIGDITNNIKEYIETLGSFQDVDRGWYGLKQKKVSVSYDAAKFESAYPDAARLVIVKAVNEKALAGLIKGGLIAESDLKDKGITQEKESYSYIIQVA